ncbi:MAG: DNA cytosine methyltransferase [Thermodesulfobacteriota bacterium]
MSRSVISLFTGAGGLDLGFEAAGFDVAVAVEMDQDCVATLAHNRDWPVVSRSIHEIPSAELLGTARLTKGEADVLIGGPPCQPFSKSGYWASGDTRRLDDPRASTLQACLRVLQDTLPRVFLMENVAGLAYSRKDEAFRLIADSIAAINRSEGTGYTLELLVLNAVDFGVPQIRERAFLIGARDGLPFGELSPTHWKPSGLCRQRTLADQAPGQCWRTTWDAIGDLEDAAGPDLRLTGKWADLLPSIPEGENYLFHTDRGGGLPLFGWRRRFWNFLLKLSKALPSWTLTASPGPATGPFHWRSRRLSVREMARLQTFPADYTVVGSYRAAQRQIGNAVPCALAERLAIEIRRRLFRDDEAKRLEPTLVPPRRADMPGAEPVVPAPAKYRHLTGTHEPHPGTGKGNRARQRIQSVRDG